MNVQRIDKRTAQRIVAAKHYSRRLGIFWEGFALEHDGAVIGIITYGQPSAPIQKHAFADRAFRLYELSRMVIDRGAPENAASFLISHSLKLLSVRPCAVISYADSSHGHCGIVYQATNWTYTGGTVAHDCLYKVDGELLHPMTVKDRYGVSDPVRWATDNDIERVKPGIKHRYFYFIGTRAQKRAMQAQLRYPAIAAYPKVDKTLYDDGAPCATYL